MSEQMVPETQTDLRVPLMPAALQSAFTPDAYLALWSDGRAIKKRLNAQRKQVRARYVSALVVETSFGRYTVGGTVI